MLGVYVHDLDPVLISFTEALKIRWYGLAYLGGFVLGWLLLRWMAHRKLWVLEESKVSDFVAYTVLFGVFLGGRLGYILFYFIPDRGWQALLADPLIVLKVWEGGMASHGGILGVMLYSLYYALRHGYSWTGLGDGLVVVAPIGLFLGRIANFINGELYGRIAHGVSWAVKFPKTLDDPRLQSAEFAERNSALQAANALNPNIGPSVPHLEHVMRENEAVQAVVEPYLSPRHPSQLYEGLLEGLLLFLILFLMRIKWPRLPHGLLTGLFFLLYAIFRIGVENYREPDHELVLGGWLTKGQFYSLGMILIGLIFLTIALRRPHSASDEANQRRHPS